MGARPGPKPRPRPEVVLSPKDQSATERMAADGLLLYGGDSFVSAEGRKVLPEALRVRYHVARLPQVIRAWPGGKVDRICALPFVAADGRVITNGYDRRSRSLVLPGHVLPDPRPLDARVSAVLPADDFLALIYSVLLADVYKSDPAPVYVLQSSGPARDAILDLVGASTQIEVSRRDGMPEQPGLRVVYIDRGEVTESPGTVLIVDPRCIVSGHRLPLQVSDRWLPGRGFRDRLDADGIAIYLSLLSLYSAYVERAGGQVPTGTWGGLVPRVARFALSGFRSSRQAAAADRCSVAA